jgi:hypothetical protein
MFTRTSLKQPFESAQRLDEPVSSKNWDMPCWLSEDLCFLIVSKQFSTSAGTVREVFWLQRDRADAPFAAEVPLNVPLAELRSADRQSGFMLSGQGRALYFAADLPGGHGDQDIWVSRRIPKMRLGL